MRTNLGAAAAALLTVPAAAVGLSLLSDPAVAADFLPTTGSYVVDTTTLTITGPGGSASGSDVGGVAVFAFDAVSIPSGVTLRVVGTRPFRLEASGNLSVGGAIQGDGTSATDASTAGTPGGPGGGAGGMPGTFGTGTGGGGAPLSGAGAGGGGFGGAGARGGGSGSGTGGPAYGPLHLSVQGGSGGGGSPAGGVTRGGGGGGALELVGASVVIAPGAIVSADGGAGAYSAAGASGGGSGGAIVVRGTDVEVDGFVRARGGAGGAGDCCGDGGGGGGGRVAYVYSGSLVEQPGATSVSGGLSGFNSTSGHASGLHGPDQTGASGVVTAVHASAFVVDAHTTIAYGTTTALEATLTDAVTGDPLADRQVDLFQRPAAGGGWELLGTFSTSAAGTASTSVQPTANTDYEWRYGGEAEHQPTTVPQSVAVAQVVSLRSSPVRPAAGKRYQLWGKVRPSVAGEPVRLQRKSGTRWKTLATATVERQRLPGGTAVGYVFKRTATKGTSKFRVVKPATATLAQGTSPVVTVRVG